MVVVVSTDDNGRILKSLETFTLDFRFCYRSRNIIQSFEKRGSTKNRINKLPCKTYKHSIINSREQTSFIWLSYRKKKITNSKYTRILIYTIFKFVPLSWEAQLYYNKVIGFSDGSWLGISIALPPYAPCRHVLRYYYVAFLHLFFGRLTVHGLSCYDYPDCKEKWCTYLYLCSSAFSMV